MKIFAGAQFQTKNPIPTAERVSAKIASVPPMLVYVAIKNTPRPIAPVSIPASPSIPSMKLNRLINQIQRKTMIT